MNPDLDPRGALTPVIRPNRSDWVLPSGRVVDVETEGMNDDGSAFSHGIYVKQLVSFRIDRFFPDLEERKIAAEIRRRAKELIQGDPELAKELDDDGLPNPYSGDLAFDHTAEEQGWIRIKSLTQPRESTIYAETISGHMSERTRSVIDEAAERQNCRVEVLAGGALRNRASRLKNPE
jgi:hypothetical protein